MVLKLSKGGRLTIKRWFFEVKKLVFMRSASLLNKSIKNIKNIYVYIAPKIITTIKRWFFDYYFSKYTGRLFQKSRLLPHIFYSAIPLYIALYLAQIWL